MNEISAGVQRDVVEEQSEAGLVDRAIEGVTVLSIDGVWCFLLYD